jgi:hypothetical protein
MTLTRFQALVTVMAETQISPESSLDLTVLRPKIRQDPAVCVSLPSNSIVKEQNREHEPVRRLSAGAFETTRLLAG